MTSFLLKIFSSSFGACQCACLLRELKKKPRTDNYSNIHDMSNVHCCCVTKPDYSCEELGLLGA
uniref:Secreted protein n=1 Tax=Glossina pallidipes TaxID=7398 RepID=A0A1B0A6B7_GLOPL